MDLQPPAAGLRRIGNRSKSPIHTQVVIPVGDDLEVSDYVADQLVASGLTDETPTVDEKPRRAAKKTAAKQS